MPWWYPSGARVPSVVRPSLGTGRAPVVAITGVDL